MRCYAMLCYGIQGELGSEWSAADEERNPFLHVLLWTGTPARAGAAGSSAGAADAAAPALLANRRALVTALDLHKSIRGAMRLA